MSLPLVDCTADAGVGSVVASAELSNVLCGMSTVCAMIIVKLRTNKSHRLYLFTIQ